MKPGKRAVTDESSIEGWLLDMGYSPRKVQEDSGENIWIFQFTHPVETSHNMMVLKQTKRPRAVVVLSQVNVSPEHTAAFQELEEEEKLDFLRDLQGTLNRDYTEYAIQGLERGLSCPTGFMISACRYDDGLTIDSMARTISSVFKTEQAAILCFQKHLAPRSTGGSGDFEFRRMIQ